MTSVSPENAGASRGAHATRERILLAAERLFAANGVDAVTLRQIARAADQRNVAAVQYHFGGKEALLVAILERHQAGVDAARRRLLDRAEVMGQVGDLTSLVDVLVDPLAEKLDDESGRAYLEIQSERRVQDPLRPATRLMVARIGRLVGEAGAMRDRFAFILLFGALADRVRLEASGDEGSTRERFVDALKLAIIHILRPESPRRAGPGSESVS